MDLLESLNEEPFGTNYRMVNPTAENRFSFRPITTSVEFQSWPRVTEFASEELISGLQEMRRGGFIDIDRKNLEFRMRRYFDASISWDELTKHPNGLTQDAGGFVARTARRKALAVEEFDETRIRRYSLYPFDDRWAYYTTAPTLWNRPRPNLARHQRKDNLYFVTRMAAERPDENVPIIVSTHLPDYHLLRPNGVAIPIKILGEPVGDDKTHSRQPRLPGTHEPPLERANLSTSRKLHNYQKRGDLRPEVKWGQ